MRSPLNMDKSKGCCLHIVFRPTYLKVTCFASTSSFLPAKAEFPMSIFISVYSLMDERISCISRLIASIFSCCTLFSLDVVASDLLRNNPMEMRATHFFAFCFSPLEACFCCRSIVLRADFSAFASSFC